MLNRTEADYIEFLYNATHPEVHCSNPPHQYFLDVSNYCNLSCLFCIRPEMEREKGMMSMDTFRRIIDSIVSCYGHIPCVDFARQGEAMLLPHLPEMVAYAKSKGCHSTRVQTNGLLMNEERARRLIQAGVDKVNFSFGSHDAALYNQYQPGGDFERTLRQILRFLELKQEMNRPDLEVVISTVEFERLADTKDEFVRVFSQMPFNKVKINQFDNWLGDMEWQPIDSRRQQPRNQWPLCKLPWRILAFSWDGTAVPCNNDYNNSFPLGNINDKSIEDLWNGEAMKSFRRTQIERRYEDVEKPGRPLCSQCNAMFDDPTRNSPTYPASFTQGLREFAETGVMGGGRKDESRSGASDLEAKYQFLRLHKEEWMSRVLSSKK